MNGGHAQRFFGRVLGIIKASERVEGKALGRVGGCGVNRVAALEALGDLPEGAFHCRIRLRVNPVPVVVKMSTNTVDWK